MAGAVGFEPTIACARNKCLTIWPRAKTIGIIPLKRGLVNQISNEMDFLDYSQRKVREANV